MSSTLDIMSSLFLEVSKSRLDMEDLQFGVGTACGRGWGWGSPPN